VANNAPEDVIWTVTGNTSQDETIIDENGLLTVSGGEFSCDLTVTATSVYNSAISGSTTVRVPQITRFEVIPPIAIILRDTQQQFTIEIEGIYNPPEGVTWNTSIGYPSFIDQNGLLSVSSYETNALFAVIASSHYDAWSQSYADIYPVSVYDITINPPSAILLRGGTQQFTANVTGFGASLIEDVWKEVIWSVANGVAGTTISDTGLLSVANNETATMLQVTATSAIDHTISATSNVGVGQINSVTFDYAPTSVNLGYFDDFTARISAFNGAPTTLIWEITSDHTDSFINQTDNIEIELHVGWGETATSITVRASSAYDPSKYAEATVMVVP